MNKIPQVISITIAGVLFGLGSWWVLVEGPATIDVKQATYGANCNAFAGNMTDIVGKTCNRLSSRELAVDVGTIGDPAPGYGKDFTVQYQCGTAADLRTATLPSGVGAHHEIIRITCEANER
jgi:hypothetical protein